MTAEEIVADKKKKAAERKDQQARKDAREEQGTEEGTEEGTVGLRRH